MEENIGSTFFDIHHSKILFDPPPTVIEIKTKVSKWGLIKLTSFCTANETINKIKRQPLEWKKIIPNETDQGLISKIYKQLMQLNTRNKQPIQKKMGRRLKQTFPHRRQTDGQQTHEKMLSIAPY